MKQIRHLFVVLLLLAYGGQSLAAFGAPCAMMSSSSSSDTEAGMAGMDHSGHDMSAHAADDGGSSCCEDGTFCSMSECQSTIAMPLNLAAPAPAPAAGVIGAITAPSPILQSSSLFRPPISA